MSIEADSAGQDTIVGVSDLVVEIIVEGGDWRGLEPHQRAVAAAIGALVGEVPSAAGEITLVLASDARVCQLNRQFRGQDHPTNVLSFPQPAHPPGGPAGQPPVLGDIVLAAETLLREAGQLAMAPMHHFQHLVIHGVLHLLGHDHAADAEAAVMEAIEIRALARLGIANPYDEDPPGARAVEASGTGGRRS